MPRRWIACAVCLLLLSLRAGADDLDIAGRVLGDDERHVAGVLVVVCDQQTGLPVHEKTWRPFTELLKCNRANLELLDFACAVTDEQGGFAIDGPADGEYRLIAQLWIDAEKPVAGALEKNGRIVELCGIAEHVRVPSDEALRIILQPAGSASLRIDLNIGNDDCLLVVSAAPLAADPILGFTSWSGFFMPRMLAGNRMLQGDTTVHGLPAGNAHVAVFANDNNPGFGRAQVELAAHRITEVELPIIASWSDGHHDPPLRLARLVEKLRMPGGLIDESCVHQQLPELLKLMQQKPANQSEIWTRFVPLLDREITLDDGSVIPVKDWLAVKAYIELVARVDQRQRRAQRQRSAAKDTDTSVTYEQAFEDLYAELGARYPCFELKGIDWMAVGDELLPRAAEVTDDESFGLLCMELVARLEDSHSQLLAGAAQLPVPPLPRWDPGFACLADDRGMPVVYHVDEGGPAEAAGIEIGMTIQSINSIGADAAIEDAMSLYRRYIGHSSERYLRYQCFRWFTRRLVRGEKLTIEAVDGDGHSCGFLVAATMDVRYLPRLPVPSDGISDSANISYKMLADNVGYIYVRRIRGDLIERLDEAVGSLQGASGLIIDVRGNSGGGFDGARAHLNFARDRDEEEPDRPRFRGPIAVLIDARCLSAGEGWASWFRARDRARLFGETTAGASSTKATYTLTNGLYKVRYSVRARRGYLDRPIEHVGIAPDVQVMPSACDIACGRDTVIEASKRWLIQQAPR